MDCSKVEVNDSAIVVLTSIPNKNPTDISVDIVDCSLVVSDAESVVVKPVETSKTTCGPVAARSQ